MRHRSLPRKAMWIVAGVLAVVLPVAFGQYPGHIDTTKRAGPPLRSIAVLEWTGTAGKPTASRLIPIAVFDGETYQPGGLYLARPEPLALDSGTEYILQRAGVPQGLFDVNGAQDAGGYWLGYGLWRKITPPPMRRLPQGRLRPQVVKDVDDGRPHLVNHTQDNSSTSGSQSSSGSAKSGSSSNQSPPADSDRPVLVRRTDDSGSGSGQTSGSSGSSSQGTNSGSSSNSNAGSGASNQSAPVDPDRPVLRRRSESSPENNASYLPGGPETAIGGPDPDRPRLSYGTGEDSDTGEQFEEPKLTGTPEGLEQMVAVSDATDREPHPFAYSWADPGDAAKMQAQMETLAQQALVAAAQPAKTPAKTSASKTSTSRTRTTAAARRARKPPAAPLPQLSDERFAAYQLTYNSGATLVFTAKSVDASGKVKYVTLIAQPDFYGVPRVIFTSVAEDGMLDFTPRMQFVDAVDVRGNNRGDLIFELRSAHDRQFAIYQVVEGQVQQVFVTGSLPLTPGQASASGS